MKKLLALVTALLFATAAYGQTAGRITNHAFAIGKGPNVTGFTSLLCSPGQLAIGSAADPVCTTLSGDATLSAAGVVALATVNANVGTFGSSTNCLTVTVDGKGRITAASQTACTASVGSISGLGAGVATWLATPSGANLLAALTTKTGTGLPVFGTSPNITTPTGIVKGDVGLGNVDNTSDVNKPVSTAQQTALNLKVATVKKQVFTASGTYTPSTGMLYAIIECVGAGGGGGSAAGTVGNVFGGGGGGGGSYSRTVATAATIGVSQTVTIAAGGAGGATGSNNGSAGGDSSVGAICVGKGGAGGLFGSVAQAGIGGAGGIAGTGDLTAMGVAGASGLYNSVNATIVFPAGAGAASAFGGGAASPGTASGAATAGITATGFGGGGSGAYANSVAANAAGGAGFHGAAFVTEFCSQ